MFDRYNMELTLQREMLGTNPCDPAVHDTHILQKQRKLIMEKSGINTQINKYLDQIPIAKEKGEEEVNRIIDKLEEMLGYTLSLEDRDKMIAGELEGLKETFKELDYKGITVFFWDKETSLPCIGDHMIYGFMKAASEAISRTEAKKAGAMLQSTTHTKSIINQHVGCDKQFIPFDRDIARLPSGLPRYCQRSLRAMTPQGPRVTLAKSEEVPAGAKLSFQLKVMKNSPLTLPIIERIFDYGELKGLGQWRNSGKGVFTHKITRVQ